jgi:uncharacterized protein (TIGR00730 family)
MKRVCVYCGSSSGRMRNYGEMAKNLGNALANQNLDLVYGGADIGLMGELADAVLAAGGKAIGVIPESFANRVSHHGLTELHITASMHERKKMMFDLSDAFIALPGGLGTIEELMELLTWAQLGFHHKPCGILNVSGYFDYLLSFIDHATSEGFIKPEHRDMLLVSEEPAMLLERFRTYDPARIDKWNGSLIMECVSEQS